MMRESNNVLIFDYVKKIFSVLEEFFVRFVF